jgi:hypothetical protein
MTCLEQGETPPPGWPGAGLFAPEWSVSPPTASGHQLSLTVCASRSQSVGLAGFFSLGWKLAFGARGEPRT